jgi:biopolymer transport protein TolQ
MTPDIALPATDMSFWSLFMNAHLVVKLVIFGLLASSVICWAIILEKGLLFSNLKRQMNKFENIFWSGQSLEELFRSIEARPHHGMAAVFVAAMREWKRTQESSGRGIGGLKDRIEKVMDVTIAREAERLESRLLFLASIGSSGPFIGLFGTVWGIMTSFQAIAVSKNTNLAVVAPGIAEALFATAVGLVAAIPAVIAYNKLQSDAQKTIGRMEGFADEFSAIISRQIDERFSG